MEEREKGGGGGEREGEEEEQQLGNTFLLILAEICSQVYFHLNVYKKMLH